MPWVRASLRGQTVYARADAAGALVAEEGGGVEIRYKPHDGRKYRARADNLTIADPKVLPDDTCGPAEAVVKARAGEQPEGAGGAGAAAPAGPARAQRKAPARGATAAAPVPEGAVIVYADGACSGNPGPAGLGVVIIDGGQRIERSEYLGTGTNNIAELTAILRALEEVEPGRPIVIHTDSQYSIGVLQKGWKAKANVELVASLREALQARRPPARLVYVPGHAGVLLNERADALAREAVRERASRRTVYPGSG
ncbi:ribonuclease HI [Sorangium sp. So ce1335]|uniref:ribonuclease HI n=1 Tax=Sorangium sp. So ce1335 TaxID=3133335 RepID=UPI003F633A30